MKKEKKALRWVRLDNAAKIYPAVKRKNWSNVYRYSATLSEEVDKTVLKRALDATVPRFPTIAARLRFGVFWYYLEQVAEAPTISEEYSYPLVYMSAKEMSRCAFRVIVYGRRLALEFFHALTDGTGALIFLKTLLAEYLEQKYGISVPCEDGVLDRREAPFDEEMEDCFPKYAGVVPASRKDTNAWHMTGDKIKDGFLHLTCFKLPTQDLLALAHRYGVTVTVCVNALMMQALVRLQNEKNPSRKRQKRIKVLIPINLRQLFLAKTLRNFSMYTIPEIDPRLGEYSFEEICGVIAHKMGAEFTAKQMSRVIAANVNDEKNPIVRLIPLPIKNLVMRAIFDSVGEKKACLNLSNVGRVKLPDEMTPYIERFDFILGIQAAAPYNGGMLSYGDTVYINFIRNIRDAELERHFHAVLRDMGLSVTVESNRNER